MTLWKAYLDNGKTVELQDKIRKWLWGKDNEAKLNRRALQMLQYDLEQLFYSTLQENGIQAHQFLYIEKMDVTELRQLVHWRKWMHGLRKLWELFPGSCRTYRT